VVDPFVLFSEWRGGAETEMVLATASTDGVPSARTVLLRGVDTGFVFYTNLGSRKGQELTANPRASLVFRWPTPNRQVVVCGAVSPVSAAEADAYFASRPRGHQLGAWASRQSAVLASREELIERVGSFEERFAGSDVPRPPFWGGFRVVPETIEFWEGRPDRLHDRVRYSRSGSEWVGERIYP
jgi:pyridoxamine 5'-phosphate oxidase